MKKSEMEDIPRVCALCMKADSLGESGYCICKNKGMVSESFGCGKFKLDLLKLSPRPHQFEVLSPVDVFTEL